MTPREPITYRLLAQCCERETSKRKHVYPRLVDAGKLTASKADREIELMTMATEHFRKLADEEDRKARLL